MVWQARLAESEAKLKYTVQARERTQLLEEEVEALRQGLAQTEVDSQAFATLMEENRVMKESLTALKQAGGNGLLEAKYQSSLDEVNSLRVQLADAQAEITKFSRGTGRERAGLQEYIVGLEKKIADMEKQLAEANANSAELKSLEDESMALQEEAAALRAQLAGRSDSSSSSEDQTLQRQVRSKLTSFLF